MWIGLVVLGKNIRAVMVLFILTNGALLWNDFIHVNLSVLWGMLLGGLVCILYLISNPAVCELEEQLFCATHSKVQQYKERVLHAKEAAHLEQLSDELIAAMPTAEESRCADRYPEPGWSTFTATPASFSTPEPALVHAHTASPHGASHRRIKRILTCSAIPLRPSPFLPRRTKPCSARYTHIKHVCLALLLGFSLLLGSEPYWFPASAGENWLCVSH